MSAVRGFLGGVWEYGVSLPFFMLRSLVVGTLGWLVSFLFPVGYKPCNHMLDPFMDACANRPAGEGVRLPWVDSSATETLVMNNTGRLLSYIAIAKGWFGVAVKETGNGASAKRHYRYYYRRDLTGNWFAEIWSVPKSALIAGALSVPLLETAAKAVEGRAPAHAGLLLLVAGLLLVICFLPRALLGRGTHFVSMAPINGGLFGGYGCAGLINWVAGLGGLSFLWLGMASDWDLAATTSFLFSEAMSVVSDFAEGVSTEGIWVLLVIPASLVVGPILAIASIAIPAGALWYVSLRFMAARNAKAELLSLPYNTIQENLWLNSTFNDVAELRAPQVFFGFLVYLGALFGFVLYPMTAWIFSIF